MVKEAIRIYCRVRPLSRRHTSGIYSLNQDECGASSLEITVPRDLADGFVNNKRESYKFRFQETFDQDAKQEAVFDHIAKPVAESLICDLRPSLQSCTVVPAPLLDWNGFL